MSLYNSRVMHSLAVTECFTVSEQSCFLERRLLLDCVLPEKINSEERVSSSLLPLDAAQSTVLLFATL